MQEYAIGAAAGVGLWLSLDWLRRWVTLQSIKTRATAAVTLEQNGPLPRKPAIAKGAKLKPKANDDLAAWQAEREQWKEEG